MLAFQVRIPALFFTAGTTVGVSTLGTGTFATLSVVIVAKTIALSGSRVVVVPSARTVVVASGQIPSGATRFAGGCVVMVISRGQMLALQRRDFVRVIKKLKASDVGTNILCKDRGNGSKSQSGGNDRETHSEFVVTEKKKKPEGNDYNGPSFICRSNCAAKLLI